jgi:hypothetical protein
VIGTGGAGKSGTMLALLPLVGCVVAGLIGIAGAVLGMEKDDSRFTGGGVFAVAAAIAFGLLANAILRK